MLESVLGAVDKRCIARWWYCTNCGYYTPQTLSKQERAANFVFQFACHHLFSLHVPSVRSIPPAAELDDLAGFQQFRQRALDGDLTDIRAPLHNFALGDLAEVVFDDLAHPGGLGKPLGGQQFDPALKIPVPSFLQIAVEGLVSILFARGSGRARIFPP